jgi:hypothetical protein
VAHGPDTAFAAGGIEAPVLDDTVNRFSAIAEREGIDSACSERPVRFTEDSSAPDTRIRSGPGPRRRLGSAFFTLAALPPGRRTTFRCALDGRALRRCPRRVGFHRLGPGRHRFRAHANDAAGNSERSPARRGFRVPARRR